MLLVERRTIRNVQRGKNNLCIGIDETDFGQTADHHLALSLLLTLFLGIGNCAQFVELDACIVLGNDGSIGGCVTCHTTGVERTKRKLCTRFTDGLGCDDTHGLTHLHHALCGKVASVTLHADATLRLTGEHGTNLNHLDRRCLDGSSLLLGDFLACSADEFARGGMDDIVD